MANWQNYMSNFDNFNIYIPPAVFYVPLNVGKTIYANSIPIIGQPVAACDQTFGGT